MHLGYFPPSAIHGKRALRQKCLAFQAFAFLVHVPLGIDTVGPAILHVETIPQESLQ